MNQDSIHSSSFIVHNLFRFLVRPVHPAIIAELFELKPIWRLLLVLRRDVITMLAFCALKRDVISWHNSSTAKLKVYQQNRQAASYLESGSGSQFHTHSPYSIISDTVPAPTVLPPSLIANLNPFSIAIGLINSISNCELSPGITISTPSANVATPVTSVVRK
jgi:hypothetical protein